MTNNSNFLQACPALAAWSTNCRSNAWCSGKVLPQRVLALWNVCVCVRACVRVCACALRYYEVNMQQCRVGMSITELCFGCRSVNKDLLQQNTKIQENTHTHTHTHTHTQCTHATFIDIWQEVLKISSEAIWLIHSQFILCDRDLNA